jgi:hypothetical protein
MIPHLSRFFPFFVLGRRGRGSLRFSFWGAWGVSGVKTDVVSMVFLLVLLRGRAPSIPIGLPMIFLRIIVLANPYIFPKKR